jgi:lipopolysaccharide/colanic/teichoic acid biosynthesis glycosyltransferase
MTDRRNAAHHEDHATLMHTAVAERRGIPGREAPLPPLVAPVRVDRLDVAVKRALDILVSLTMLVALFPLLLLVAVAIVLESRGPVFFRSPRIGRGGRELPMLKFRKMHADAAGIPLTTHTDARLTRVGAFLARSKLDELPQLWHVLRGEMSLVGPRPETLRFVDHHRPEYDEILSVRPGLVGLSQIAFVAEGRILDEDDPLEHYVSAILPQKVRLDLIYARGRTMLLDLRILVWSVVAVLLRREVAVHRHTGRMNLRKR